MSLNVDIGKTRITDKIRVSSAIIFYEIGTMYYFQYETWVFSDDDRQKSRQFIHGTSLFKTDKLAAKTITFHRRATQILLHKFNNGI